MSKMLYNRLIRLKKTVIGGVKVARPKKLRRICAYPKVMGFRPFGDYAEVVDLTFDEYEVMRLMDTLGYSQEECAIQMDIARSPVASIYNSARAKTADAIIYGKSLVIHGGDIELCKGSSTCCGKCGKTACKDCGHGESLLCSAKAANRII